MARTSDAALGDGAVLHQRHRQRFLNFKSETPQGWGYAVFGKVVAGSDVVDAIEQRAAPAAGRPRRRAARRRDDHQRARVVA